MDNILEVHNYMQHGPSPPPPQEQVPDQPVVSQSQSGPSIPQQSSGSVLQEIFYLYSFTKIKMTQNIQIQ